MRIMITGGRGFIGRHVAADAERRGHSVRILAHDLRQSDGLAAALRGVDAVIHCAAATSGDPAAHKAVTVDGTRRLLAAMKEAGVGAIAGISTFALYDYRRIPMGALLDESAPLTENFDGLDPYVQAKRQQEDMIREQANANRWRWTILRPGIVFGPGRTWFHQLGAQISANRWLCYAGDSQLPLTYVGNCAEAIVLALETDVAHGATINIVDDDLPDRREYVAALARRTQPRPTVAHVPWPLLDSAADIAGWIDRVLLFGRAPLPALLRRASLHARCKPLRYTNARAKRVLAWTPRWTVAQAIERSFDSPTPGSVRL